MPFFIWDLEASGKCHIRFVTLLRFCHNDCIDQTSRNNGITRTRRCIYKTIHLHNDFSTICLNSLTDGQCIARHKHIIKCNISFSVCSRSLDHGYRDLWQFIIKKFISVYFHMLDQRIINRNTINSRSFSSWINKNIQSNLR